MSGTLLRNKKGGSNRRTNPDSSSSVYSPTAMSPSQASSCWYTTLSVSANSNTSSQISTDTLDRRSSSRPNSGNYNHRNSIHSQPTPLQKYSSTLSIPVVHRANKTGSDMNNPPPLPAKQNSQTSLFKSKSSAILNEE